MIEVICFFVVLTMGNLTVNQDGVGERAEIIQSLSQLTLTALFTKESRVCDLLKLLIYSGKTFQII